MKQKITKEKVKQIDTDTLIKQSEVNYVNKGVTKAYSLAFIAILLVTGLFAGINYGLDNENKVVIILGCTTLIGLFLGVIGFMLVKNTVGWNLGIKLMKMRRLRYKGFVILKVFHVSGRPQYNIVKASSRIVYIYEENGIKKKKVVFYDPYGKYEDFLGIPIIECNPNDIQLKNTFNGSRIGAAPEIIEKNITDNSMSAAQIDTLKAQRRWILIAFGIVAGLTLLGFDLYAQRLAAANEATVACYRDAGKTAIIQSGLFIMAWFRKEDLEVLDDEL